MMTKLTSSPPRPFFWNLKSMYDQKQIGLRQVSNQSWIHHLIRIVDNHHHNFFTFRFSCTNVFHCTAHMILQKYSSAAPLPQVWQGHLWLLQQQEKHPHRPRTWVSGISLWCLCFILTLFRCLDYIILTNFTFHCFVFWIWSRIMQVRVCENCYITITDHEKTPRANFFDTRYKHIQGASKKLPFVKTGRGKYYC